MTTTISKLALRAMTLATVACVSATVACGDAGTGPGSTGTPGLKITPARALATGNQFACLLTTAGEAWCWGADSLGTLGDGGSSDSNIPVPISGVPPFVQLSASDNSVCGLTASGQVWCWGDIPGVQGTVNRTPRLQQAAAAPLTSIAVGYDDVCGLDASGAAYCWGLNNFGQLGLSDTLVRAAPTRVASGTTFTSISASVVTTCALASGGAAMCWGLNEEEALGTGAAPGSEVRTPQAVTGGHIFTSLAAGGVDTCGLVADGTAYCWGTDNYGEAGVPPSGTQKLLIPTAVFTNAKFTSILPGRANTVFQVTCAVALDGTAYCAGYNGASQVGPPSGSLCLSNPGIPSGPQVPCTTSPSTIAGLGPVETIATGGDYTCAITRAKQVMCWGSNSHGELGDGTVTARATPAAIQGTYSLP